MSDHPPLARREPLLTAPWPPVLLSLALVALYAAQVRWGGEVAVARYALVPLEVSAGRWPGLFTYMFVHADWPHVLLNSAFALAFGTGVARHLGPSASATTAFVMFYLLCGLIAGGAFVALHPLDGAPVVGASGAVSGLMGAGSRLIDRPGRVSGLLSRTAVGMGLAWLVINLIAAVFGTLPLAGGAAIAWESHLAGYAAGLLLIAPVSRMFAAR